MKLNNKTLLLVALTIATLALVSADDESFAVRRRRLNTKGETKGGKGGKGGKGTKKGGDGSMDDTSMSKKSKKEKTAKSNKGGSKGPKLSDPEAEDSTDDVEEPVFDSEDMYTGGKGSKKSGALTEPGIDSEDV
jgi:hypothetical protein